MTGIEYRRRRTVVVGTGVAGLTTALALGDATVLTKTTLGDSGSTPWSQGGIAAAVGTDDTAELHTADTMAVGGGIADAVTAALLTGSAAERIHWLIDVGARFDREADGTLALGREAGHSRRRILHAGGDATGAEVARALAGAAMASPAIEVAEDSFAVDLLTANGRVVGLLAREAGRLVAYLADAVVIASGGIGQVYARTTNPPGVTGDGLAMAARAGATLADLEFVQFHPTALAVPTDPLPLLTEALRGEGAVLVDGAGHRFMPAEHPDAELAPRDVVARAIWRRLAQGELVYLDATSAVGPAFPDRFPTVYRHATAAGIDPVREPMPVTPAAHYHMGGIAVDADGRTSLPGLWACGEASSTGLHGANRLASNSLLEGLVFGGRVAESIRAAGTPGHADQPIAVPAEALAVAAQQAEDLVAEVRRLMWDWAGLMRTAEGLDAAIAALDTLAEEPTGDPTARNLLVVARCVAGAAAVRQESRGAHHRLDFPEPDARLAARSFVTPAPAPTVEVGDAAAVAAA